MLFDKHINKILKEMVGQNPTPQVSSSMPQKETASADSLMKQAAILRAQAQSLNDGSSMYDTRVAMSQSPAAKNAVAQKIKQAEELEARAKKINPNIKQTYSLPLPPKDLKTPRLRKKY